jgi:hypothetical protein
MERRRTATGFWPENRPQMHDAGFTRATPLEPLDVELRCDNVVEKLPALLQLAVPVDDGSTCDENPELALPPSQGSTWRKSGRSAPGSRSRRSEGKQDFQEGIGRPTGKCGA